jgi:2-oxo-4-hydroxy-4-carboxy-5-ureidoimidazoline decarboxylase
MIRSARSLTPGIFLAMTEREYTVEEFVRRYGGIYEHSPWVAEEVFGSDIDPDDTELLATLFAECVDNASHDRRLTLIRAHPDLAGRAAIAGELTLASTDEQSSAGIDQCSPEEFARFEEMNDRYKETFKFPFVMAVRGSNRKAILAAFEERLANSPLEEFERAISEIHKIARLRLKTMQNHE